LARGFQPTIPLFLVGGDPLIDVTLDVLCGFLAILHAGILRVDIAKREGENLKELLGGRVLFEELLVGNDSDVGDNESQLDRISDRPFDTADRQAVGLRPGLSLKMVQLGAQV